MEKQRRQYNCIKNRKGFTLVELMVVLAILAILSSVAVFSIIGYIDKSRFDKNEQNAQSVFQAVQTELERKKNRGEIEEWIQNELLVKGTADPHDEKNYDEDDKHNVLDVIYNESVFDAFPGQNNSVGDSVHMRYILTHQKGGDDAAKEAVLGLIGGYFYDTTVLDATFTIEFDVEKKIAGDEQVHYNVNAYAVFYDEKRDGWDTTAMNENSDVVPWRKYDYRYDTSLVGYYNGGNPSAVDSVYTPIVNPKMEFAELALRNGEKLELSFSVKNGDNPVTGTGVYHIHYTASLYDAFDDSWLADLVVSEAYLKNPLSSSSPEIQMTDYEDLFKKSIGNIESITDGQVIPIQGTEYTAVCTKDEMYDDAPTPRKFTRYKAAFETTALVYVRTDKTKPEYNDLGFGDLDAKTDYYQFPITVSYVYNKYENADSKAPYVSYTLALDTMMNRKAIVDYENNVAQGKSVRFTSSSITRLFGTDMSSIVSNKVLAPKNIYVSMKATADAFSKTELAGYNVTADLPSTDCKNAKRAYDDPVYYVADGMYVYKNPLYADPKECATRDQAGYAVCNTLFGDLGEGSFGNKNDCVMPDGESSSNKYQRASITSFRHLSNMRYTTNYKYTTSDVSKPVVYEIQRDLDWYSKTGSGFTSEVEVFNAAMSGISPVDYYRGISSDLKVVSWPALPEVSENQMLVARENSANTATGDRTSVIRNVQMRRQSFVSTDEGYGFICKNEGTIRNIRCENFCLTFESIADGGTEPSGKSVAETLVRLFKHGDDKSDSFINIDDNKKYKLADDNQMNPYPVGGLIGVQNGMLGVNDHNIPKDENTIRMSNPIVLVGIWEGSNWKKFRMYIRYNVSDPDQPAGIGGVIGYYSKDANSAGYIETDGDFAIAGAYFVGGVIGNVHGGVDACLCVDSEKETTGNVVAFPAGVDSLIMGRKFIGGAVGYVVEGYFAQKIPVAKSDFSSDNEGVVSIKEQTDAEYGISAKLAENTYIWQYGGHSDDVANGKKGYEGIGGAVGQIYKHDSGKVLSISCVNKGFLLSSNSSYGRHIGGAVGYIHQGSATEMYIYAENATTGRIGTKVLDSDGKKFTPYGQSRSAAVGIAYIEDFGKENDIYVFNVINDGVIVCNTNKEYNVGIGTAIGAYLSPSVGIAYPTLYVRAEDNGKIYAENTVNSQTTADFWDSSSEYCFGVGGAIGYIYGLQNGSHIYSQLAENAVISANGNNVGGAIGCIKKEVKGTSGDLITVTADLNNSVVIQSTGGINIGGCIGNAWGQSSYSTFRARVAENVMIYGYGNVGGVAGRTQQYATAEKASIVLQGTSPASKVSITGADSSGKVDYDKNFNIGGVIGVAGTLGGKYSTRLTISDQNSEKLILDVDGGKNIGGMTGCLYLRDLQGAGQSAGTVEELDGLPYTYSMAFHPETTITGTGKYVGGVIGYVCYDLNDIGALSDFAVDVVVSIPENAAGQAVNGTTYVGGAIGAISAPNMSGTINSYIGSSNAVNGTALVGGAIGYTNIRNTAGDITSVISATNAVTASGSSYITNSKKAGSYIGGCIGAMDGTANYGKVHATFDIADLESVSPVVGNSGYMGGCVGSVGSDSQTLTDYSGPHIAEVSVDIISKGNVITSQNNTSSCIGGVAGCVRGSTIDQITMTAPQSVSDGNSDENNKKVAGVKLDVPKASYVGGLIGLVSDKSNIKSFALEPEIDVTAYSYAGGCIGEVYASTIANPDTVNIDNIKKVIVSDAGKRTVGGVGGFIGVVSGYDDVDNNAICYSEVNCKINLTLGKGSCIQGGFNTGGAIGLAAFCKLNGDIMVGLAGGEIMSDKGGIGGAIGSLQFGKYYDNSDNESHEGSVCANVTTTVEYDYSGINNAPIHAITKITEAGMGGVIGQIGGWSRPDGTVGPDRMHFIETGVLTLKLKNDFSILSGKTSMGGVVGQCESMKATIHGLVIESIDKKQYLVTIENSQDNNFYDVGGIIGFMLGTLDGKISADNISFIVRGNKYVGGWIGGLDGTINTTSMNVSGIVEVNGSGAGVGGVIGAAGVWHGTSKINAAISADLTNARIIGKGKGVGGVIGLLGDPDGAYASNNYYSSFFGNMKVTMSGNTLIQGSNQVGGILGYTRPGSNVAKGYTYSVRVVDGSPEVKATNNDGDVGGIVGKNDAIFMPNIEIEVARNATYRITTSTQKGRAGGIMGANAGEFGMAGGGKCNVHSGEGKITVSGSKTGFILGYNCDGGKCGVLREDDGELVYHIYNVEIDKNRCDMTKPYAGYVGENHKNGSINNVVIETDIEGFDEQKVGSGYNDEEEEFIPDPIEEEEYTGDEDDTLLIPPSEETGSEEQNDETESGNTDEMMDESDVPERIESEERDTDADSDDISEPAA